MAKYLYPFHVVFQKLGTLSSLKIIKAGMVGFMAVSLFSSYGTAMQQMPELDSLFLEEKKNDIKNDNLIKGWGEAVYFQKMIETYRYIRDPNIRKMTIDSLLRIISDEQLVGILRGVFGGLDFIQKRLLMEDLLLVTQLNNKTPPVKFSSMVGRIVNRDGGSGTGLLIPLPPINQSNKPRWAILTCAHILNLINMQDKNKDEEFSFFLKNENNSDVKLNIKKIKVYRRPDKHVRIQNVIDNLNSDEDTQGGLEDVIDPSDARALPRHDIHGDVALCFFEVDEELEKFLTTNFNFLNVAWKNNILTYQAVLDNTPWTINIHFVQNTMQDINQLETIVNQFPKTQQFIAGYAGANLLTITYSKARTSDRSLYHTFISVPTLYDFYHDAPTLTGMSGGPIFYVDNQSHHIYIYGVVVGHAPDLNVQNLKLQLRCKGAFLQQSLIS